MKKSENIYHQLRQEITALLDEHRAGFPTEETLCRRYEVSRQTIRSVLLRLKEENLITSRQGSGYRLTGLYPGADNTIVLLLPDDESYRYPLFISKISSSFASWHYSVSVITTGGGYLCEQCALSALLKSPPRGLFVWQQYTSRLSPLDGMYQALADLGTCIVFMSGKSPNIKTGQAHLADHRQGGAAMAEHFLSLGHRRMAFMIFEEDIIGQERYLGFCDVLSRHGLSPDPRLLLQVSPSSPVLPSDIVEVLLVPGEEITGIICQNDLLAFGVLKALAAHNVTVPAQVSVAGFDHSHLRFAGKLRLTTMQTEPLDEAEMGCRLMYAALLGRPDDLPYCTFRLIAGNTTAPASFPHA